MTEADLVRRHRWWQAAIRCGWSGRRDASQVAVTERPVIQGHILQTDPDGCWVAEMNGIVLGYAQSFVRGGIWSLSQLFVQPEAHGHGLARAVLERAASYADARGARVRYVVAS